MECLPENTEKVIVTSDLHYILKKNIQSTGNSWYKETPPMNNHRRCFSVRIKYTIYLIIPSTGLPDLLIL